MKQLQGDYNTKLLEFIDRRTAKDKEKKAAEKLRKAEEKQRKLEEKEQKATEKLASKTAKTKAKTITKSKTQTLKIKTYEKIRKFQPVTSDIIINVIYFCGMQKFWCCTGKTTVL